MSRIPTLSAFIWPVADLLHGEHKPCEHGEVILTFQRSDET
jgi:hypothetical protein